MLVCRNSINARCLKITTKSLIQHCERSELRLQTSVNFGDFFETRSFRSKSVTRQATLIGQKLMENAKIQMRHFELFSSQNLIENAKIEKDQNETI